VIFFRLPGNSSGLAALAFFRLPGNSSGSADATRSRGTSGGVDLTPVMKHFNAKYYRVLVECLRELSLMAADYYVTATKSYKRIQQKVEKAIVKRKSEEPPKPERETD
jgi:hypothetical protein